MTNDELKTQMLEHSVYSNIEYTKIQLIDDVQWRQFDAENKEQKAKILAIMKDGYMYAIEITGEKSLYSEYSSGNCSSGSSTVFERFKLLNRYFVPPVFSNFEIKKSHKL